MTLQYEMMYGFMWAGVALASIILLPYPRFIRKPLIRGLEFLLTSKWIFIVECFFLIWTGFMGAQAFIDQKNSHRQLIEQKALLQASVEGVSRIELEKTVNKTAMHMHYSQRNLYLSSFTLVVYLVVFSYLFSVKRYDQQHDKLDKLKEREKNKSAIVPGVKDTQRQQKQQNEKKEQ